jgi:hypothetical protein
MKKQETTGLLKELKYPADIKGVYIFSPKEVIIHMREHYNKYC